MLASVSPLRMQERNSNHSTHQYKIDGVLDRTQYCESAFNSNKSRGYYRKQFLLSTGNQKNFENIFYAPFHLPVQLYIDFDFL